MDNIKLGHDEVHVAKSRYCDECPHCNPEGYLRIKKQRDRAADAAAIQGDF